MSWSRSCSRSRSATGSDCEPGEPGARADEVRCPGVDGPNICSAALASFRAATGWDGQPQLLEIEKHVPVAAGMGGGSGDAAATLRLIARRAGIDDVDLELELAAGLGADVPGQVRPGRVLATGRRRADRSPAARPTRSAILVLPSTATLSTPDVFRQADRMGLARDAAALAELDPIGRPEFVNELEPAARALDPTIDEALERGAPPRSPHGDGQRVGADRDRPLRQPADALRGGRARPAVASRRRWPHSHSSARCVHN